MRSELRKAVRLDAQEHYVYRTYLVERRRNFRMRDKIPLRAPDLHPMLLHRAQMRTARKEGDIEAGLGQQPPHPGQEIQPGDPFDRRVRVGEVLASDFHGFWATAVISIVFLLARVLHAGGMLGMIPRGRFLGAAGTLIVLIAASIMIINSGFHLRQY